MRFSIAAAVLAPILPALAKNDDANIGNIDRSDLPRWLEYQTDKVSKVSLPKSNRGEWWSPRWNPRGILKQAATTHRHAMGDKCKPDVGILSCGIGMYCKSVDDSSLDEGVCVPIAANDSRRSLEESKNGAYYFYCDIYAEYYDCDCSGWDTDTGTGRIICYKGTGLCSYSCPNICGNFVGIYTNNGEIASSSQCTYYKTPFEQVFCLTTARDQSCEMTLDGVACTSCDFLLPLCGVYDCTNVGMGTGDFCRNHYDVPIFEECSYAGPSYSPCFLCAEGVVYPDNMVDDTDTGYVSCNELDFYAQLGFVGETACARLSQKVQKTCCSVGIDKCNICGDDGGSITTPDAYVDVPGIGEYTCAHLDSESIGLVTSDLCPSVQQLAHDPCGCESTLLATPTITNGTMASNITDAPTLSPSPLKDDSTGAQSVVSGVPSILLVCSAVVACFATPLLISLSV